MVNKDFAIQVLFFKGRYLKAARKVKKVASEDSEKRIVIIMENESEQNLPARTQPKPSVPIPLLIA